jgi:hypothetical protein
MPIAARVVGDARRAAVVTSLDMTIERRSSAGRDRAHDASLGPPHMSGMVAKIGLPVMAQDIRDFDGRPAESLAPAMTDADAAYPGGITSSDKRSSGLGVARIVCAATCV